MEAREPDNPALARYARLGALLTRRRHASDTAAREALVALLEDWVERLGIQRLGAYGVTEADFGRIVANSRGSSMKTNPIVLSDDEIRRILAMRI